MKINHSIFLFFFSNRTGWGIRVELRDKILFLISNLKFLIRKKKPNK